MYKLIEKIKNKYLFTNHNSFIWQSNYHDFKKIYSNKHIPLNLLVGIEKQKKILLNNTYNFAKGNHSNLALLWGSRGNGKSTLIKSIFYKVIEEYNHLKLIQLNKKNLYQMDKVILILSNLNNFRFIIFIDDLSFENDDSDYKIIKSIIDGSIQELPSNIILYVTSNRRHLMSQSMIDNERSSAIHTDENIEEKISLSDRFGLWLGFHSLSQDDYITIIKNYCQHFDINCNEKIINNSIQWSLKRGNRNGRTAWQFIIQLAADQNLKINFDDY